MAQIEHGNEVPVSAELDMWWRENEADVMVQEQRELVMDENR